MKRTVAVVSGEKSVPVNHTHDHVLFAVQFSMLTR